MVGDAGSIDRLVERVILVEVEGDGSVVLGVTSLTEPRLESATAGELAMNTPVEASTVKLWKNVVIAPIVCNAVIEAVIEAVMAVEA